MDNSLHQALEAERWKRRNVPINKKLWITTSLISFLGIVIFLIVLFVDEMDARTFVNDYITIDTPYEDPVDDALVTLYKIEKSLPSAAQLPVLCAGLVFFTLMGLLSSKTSEDHSGLMKKTDLEFLHAMNMKLPEIREDAENMYREFIKLSLPDDILN